MLTPTTAKRRILRTLVLSLLISSMTFPLFACTGNETPGETTPPATETDTTPAVSDTAAPDTVESDTVAPETETEPEPETEEPLPTQVSLPDDYARADNTYACQDDSVLYTYKGKTQADFDAVCGYYAEQGFRVYSDTTKAGSRFTTFVGDGPMAHVYWLEPLAELNIVISETAAATLPPAEPTVTTGDAEVTVTQMKDAEHVNGMGYVVRLADGSFVVFDGAYASQAQRLLACMRKNLEEGEKPIIRAWILTHSHADHHPAFHTIAQRLADKVTVEYVIFAPIDSELARAEGGDTYFNEGIHEDIACFEGAKTVYAHMGMEFRFCNLRMEVLLSSDDLYKAGGTGYFNDTSLVTRLYDDEYNFMVTGDIGKSATDRLVNIYGDYLRSDMLQVSHHGVEDAPLSFYEVIQAPILYYPCNQWLYDQTERDYELRAALRERDYTKEVLIAGLGQYTRAWGTRFAADAPLVVWDHPTLGPTESD